MKSVFSFLINRHQDILRITLFFIAILLVGNWFPKSGKFKYDYEKNKIWKYETLFAPFSFAIRKSEDSVAAEKQRILDDLNPYYRLNGSVGIQNQKDITAAFSERYSTLNADSSILGKVKAIFKDHTKDSLEQLALVSGILAHIYERGIVQLDPKHASLAEGGMLNVVDRNTSELVQVGSFYTLADAYKFVIDSLGNRKSSHLMPLFENEIDPDIRYDDSTTQLITTSALDQISLTYGLIEEGTQVIAKGTVITAEKYSILRSLEEEYEAKQLGIGKSRLILIGYYIISALLFILLGLFLYLFEKEIYYSIRKLTFVLLVVTLTTLIVHFASSSGTFNLFVIPFCIVPIMIRTFFGSRAALYVHLTTVLIAGFIVPYGLEYPFLHLVAGIIAILANVKAYYWSQFIVSGALVLVTYSTTYMGIALIQEGDLAQIEWANFGWLGLNSLVTLLAYLLVPLFERVFGFVSDISLMELADTNRPLLKELSLKAPGTFNHSLQVANLAEAAAYEIDANTILVRVGSLYHDIGKLDQPYFFIENQNTEINPHDDLPYNESARIIIAHVSKGIEMAKKYNLPDQIIDFIRTHHGTSRVEHFYRSFLKNFPEQEVDEQQFTYPGPLPYSKETAIVMMADSVEAASRSMKNPSKEEIDNLVDQIVQSKMEQNQFENCGITFKDIYAIKKVFKNMLKSFYHVRVAYAR